MRKTKRKMNRYVESDREKRNRDKCDEREREGKRGIEQERGGS